MSRKPKHFFGHTQGEVHEVFTGLVGMLGPGYDNAFAERLLRLTIQGVRIGDSADGQRKPGSSMYATWYAETMAVANLLVQLGIDSDVADIVPRDRPDVEVRMRDGSRIYVEQRLVGSEGRDLVPAPLRGCGPRTGTPPHP